MSDSDSPDPLRLFRRLKERPTPELDPAGAWRQLRAGLGAPARQGAALPWPGRLVWGALAAMLVAAVVFTGWRATLAPGSDRAAVAPGSIVSDAGAPSAPAAAPSDPPTGTAGPASALGSAVPDPGEELVLLADPSPSAPATTTASAPDSFELDFRLVRGFTGVTPADALPESVLGAGGASLRADLEPTLRALDGQRDHAIVGVWSGEPSTPDAAVALSSAYALTFTTERDDEGISLRAVRLSGSDRPLVADEMRLEPGRLYLFGVRGIAGQPSDLFLAVRLRAVAPAAREQH